MRNFVNKILKEARDLQRFVDKIKILQGEFESKGVETEINFRQHSSIDLGKLFVTNQNSGYGSAFMDELTDICDDYGIVCTLSETDYYGSDINRLRKFYKSFGFKINNNKKKYSGSMIRYPD